MIEPLGETEQTVEGDGANESPGAITSGGEDFGEGLLFVGEDVETVGQRAIELAKVVQAVEHGLDLGLQVNAGHGLHYHNVQAIAAIPGIRELNIGHAIIARAIFSGLQPAVREIKQLMREAQTA